MTRPSPDDPIKAADPLSRNRFPIDPWRFTEVEYSSEDLGVTESLRSRSTTVRVPLVLSATLLSASVSAALSPLSTLITGASLVPVMVMVTV